MPFDSHMAATYESVIGCDEVGRGSLSGPVVVGAVWFEPIAIPGWLLDEIDDSKQLTRLTRARLAVEIRRVARVAIASASSATVDRRGIKHATLDAMLRAVTRLDIRAPVRIDGIDVPPGLSLPCCAVVRGDSTVPQIAAASIVAKVMRDRLMVRLSRSYPEYGWAKNVGYGTPEHLAALKKYGPTAYHRTSFAPVAQWALCFPDQME